MDGPDRRSLASALELAALTVLVFSYLWLWRDTFRGHGWVLLALALPLLVGSHWRRAESLARIGFRLDNLGRAGREVGLVLAPLALLVLVVGTVGGSLAFPPLERWPSALGGLVVGGVLQQYVLVGFYYRGLTELLPDTWPSYLSALSAASIFGLAHLPNPFLLGITPLVGVLSCWLYRRNPNLLALGVAHGILAFCVYYALPRTLTFGLRVGPSFFQ